MIIVASSTNSQQPKKPLYYNFRKKSNEKGYATCATYLLHLLPMGVIFSSVSIANYFQTATDISC